MRSVRKTLLALLLALAVPCGASAAAPHERELNALFDLLKKAETTTEAETIEGAIWTAWMHSGDVEADSLMAAGVTAMEAGELDAALTVFDELVRAAPDFAEAWNKRATVYYMMGDFAASVADIQRTLALEPRHFGALSGLGLIYADIGRDQAALRAFKAALQIHPHLPGASAYIDAMREKTVGRAI